MVKEILHVLDYSEAEEDARRAREAASAEEVHAIGAERLRSVGLLDHPDIGAWLRTIVERVLS